MGGGELHAIPLVDHLVRLELEGVLDCGAIRDSERCCQVEVSVPFTDICDCIIFVIKAYFQCGWVGLRPRDASLASLNEILVHDEEHGLVSGAANTSIEVLGCDLGEVGLRWDWSWGILLLLGEGDSCKESQTSCDLFVHAKFYFIYD